MVVNSHHNYLLVHGADGTYIICPACVLFHSYGENLIQSDQWPGEKVTIAWEESGLAIGM